MEVLLSVVIISILIWLVPLFLYPSARQDRSLSFLTRSPTNWVVEGRDYVYRNSFRFRYKNFLLKEFGNIKINLGLINSFRLGWWLKKYMKNPYKI